MTHCSDSLHFFIILHKMKYQNEEINEYKSAILRIGNN